MGASSLGTGLAIVLSLLSSAAASAATTKIEVVDFDFVNPVGGGHLNPTIALGDTIEWEWSATAQHSTTAAAGQLESWNSGFHSAPFTYDHTFTHTGTFNYYCAVHGFDAGGGNVGGMSGHITVVPEPATLAMFALAALTLLRRRRF